MAQVQVLINGQVATVEETSPGLFGKLGYTYVGGQTTQPAQTTQQPTLQTTASTQPTSSTQPTLAGQPTSPTQPNPYSPVPSTGTEPSDLSPSAETGQFVKVGPAFFQLSPTGLAAVSDPSILRGLQGGTIPFTTQGVIAPGANRFSSTIASQQPQQPIPKEPPTEPPITPEVVDPAQNQVSNLFAALEAMPKVEDIIKQISSQFGFDTVNKEMETLDTEYADKVSTINDNPWLSEAQRSKKVRLEQEKYETKKSALVERLRLQQDVVGKAIDMFYQERAFRQNTLFKMLELRNYELEKQERQAQRDFENQIASQKLELDRLDTEYSIAGRITGEGEGGIVKPATQAQLTVSGYATRVQEANQIIGSLESYLSGLNALEFNFQKFAPNALKSSEFQQFEQAQRNFINAILRRESGAAISESEFENARIQYFPQPGDSEEVLAQKKRNRELVQENLVRESGSAFTGSESGSEDVDIEGFRAQLLPGELLARELATGNILAIRYPEYIPSKYELL